MAKSEFPKEMWHPQFRKGKVISETPTTLDGRPLLDKNGQIQAALKSTYAEPDLFPPVIVRDPSNEAFHRAKGYLGPGEAAPMPADFSEYPVILSHPDHVDARPQIVEMVRDDVGQIKTVTIPGHPEKYPPIIAKDKHEEASAVSKGYARKGHSDPTANQHARAVPYDPDFKVEEYPKMVDGVIVDPHGAVQHNRYPMYVGDTLVHSHAEEVAIKRAKGMATKADAPVFPAQKCIICGGPFNSSDGGWENGASGPYHKAHVTMAAAKAPVEAPARDRKAAAAKAAETRMRKKERERQAATGS